jgi:hypothetical protein
MAHPRLKRADVHTVPQVLGGKCVAVMPSSGLCRMVPQSNTVYLLIRFM